MPLLGGFSFGCPSFPRPRRSPNIAIHLTALLKVDGCLGDSNVCFCVDTMLSASGISIRCRKKYRVFPMISYISCIDFQAENLGNGKSPKEREPEDYAIAATLVKTKVFSRFDAHKSAGAQRLGERLARTVGNALRQL